MNDWKNCSDLRTAVRETDASCQSWVPNQRHPLNLPDHLDSVILKGLRGSTSWAPITKRDYNRFKCFQLNEWSGVATLATAGTCPPNAICHYLNTNLIAETSLAMLYMSSGIIPSFIFFFHPWVTFYIFSGFLAIFTQLSSNNNTISPSEETSLPKLHWLSYICQVASSLPFSCISFFLIPRFTYYIISCFLASFTLLSSNKNKTISPSEETSLP